jgi:hypothetical protein
LATGDDVGREVVALLVFVDDASPADALFQRGTNIRVKTRKSFIESGLRNL